VFEERRISYRLGEDANPTARSDDVRRIVKCKRATDVRVQLRRSALEGARSSTKPPHQVAQQARHELVLVGEVVVDEAWRHSGLLGNGGDRCAGETLASKDPGECGNELGSTCFA
jgi:hypothetical protein